jgi:DNA-binding transcriptional ArsR family regulator
MKNVGPTELECIAAPRKAAVLLHPLRAELVRAAGEPVSATELASRFGLTRQRVNYHVRELARAGLLRRAGRRRKRNMIEQRYVATARSYVLSPDVIGAAGASALEATRKPSAEDEMSAAHLMALTARTQSELAKVMEAASAEQKRVSTLSLDAELRFGSAEQRAEFAIALRDAVLGVVAKHAWAAQLPEGTAASGRRYRLLVGCHPIPKESDS